MTHASSTSSPLQRLCETCLPTATSLALPNASSMPRKNKTTDLKSTLPSSSSPPSSPSHAAPERSVNDLIEHLRRTQVSGSPTRSNEHATKIAPRSVHPSLRNLLELPETPPPRPRHGLQVNRVGERRVRRTPGPAAPASWLSPSTTGAETASSSSSAAAESGTRSLSSVSASSRESRLRTMRLDRLPGAAFPRERSLQHTVLKAMALRWDWHLLYDGVFLSEIPVHLKLLLLSYIGVYTEHEAMGLHMQGFKPLFMTDNAENSGGGVGQPHSVTRLDLSRALGQWMGLKQLSRELRGDKTLRRKAEDDDVDPPASWEEEDEEATNEASPAAAHIPPYPGISSLAPAHFRDLRFLSLARPAPASASWSTLLNLLSNLATLTHLSLAHWPIPTLKPNSLRTRVRHPDVRSLTFAYGGTDIYSAYENNWSEAGTVLAKLSRTTYCLKWLDLAGCSEWIPALCWDGVDIYRGVHQASVPEWNGSWRGVEWLGIEPGWIPKDGEEKEQVSDVEAEEHRRGKQMQAYSKCIETAKEVRSRIRTIRSEGRGRWLDVSVGAEAEEM